MSIKEGEYREYKNGKIRLIENYKNGVLHGERQYFHPDESIYQKSVYNNGKIVNLTVYNREGKITYSSL